MSRFLVLITLGLCLFCSASCQASGKKSGLEGKVVDGKGQPIVGVKIVAKQVEPLKGYELFETKTGADGSFKFKKLFPTSTYELITYPDSATRNLSKKIESGPEGQTKILPVPIMIRFRFSKGGETATDTKTGLTWARNANIAARQMNWHEAMNWTQGLDIGGQKIWRLPTKVELELLAKDGGEKPSEYFNSIGFSNVQASSYWSSSIGPGPGSAWGVHMDDDMVSNYGMLSDYYVWPVRSGQ